jgi:hypothetical protein
MNKPVLDRVLSFEHMERQELIKKIEQLPPDRLAEVERFVESITSDEAESVRQDRFQAISEYAAKYAGTSMDLDEDLEAAAVESLLRETSYE